MTGTADDDARHKSKMEKRKAVQDAEVAAKTIEKGLLIVHTGKGKGKSTAAFGMVFRALGHGMKVAVVQFVKGKWQTGERVALERFGDLVTINTMGEGFTWETQDRQRDLAAARAAWEQAKALIRSGEHQQVDRVGRLRRLVGLHLGLRRNQRHEAGKAEQRHFQEEDQPLTLRDD